MTDAYADSVVTSDAGTLEPFLLPANLGACEDLTFRALQGDRNGDSPLLNDRRYDSLFETIARVLHRNHANHILLVGERGVGCHTVLAELARRGVERHFPVLAGKRFLLVDCRFVSPEESRDRLLALLEHVGHARQIVLCLDGFVSLLRDARSGGNTGVLLSALTRTSCQLIGMVAPRDCEQLLSDDPEVFEFFTRVDVHEPEIQVARKLLSHYSQGLETRFGLAIEDDAVRSSIVLSSNYILNERLPGKALKVLLRACEDLDFERTQLAAQRSTVSKEDVISVVSNFSAVPAETLRGIAESCDYESSLHDHVVGQEQAVAEMATELGLIKAGFTDAGKPASVVLFVGPTGTGKTEMAKALARFYSTSKRLRTHTLGNYVESHSVAGIIGVPPGYVGHEKGGRLINELNADPYGVFLLDEVDKAHPDVLQPFLNLFDEGWVHDQRGVRAYANKAMFILTTNVGQRMIVDMARKGTSVQEITDKMKATLVQIRHGKSNRPVFTPEFLARLKRIVLFMPLDEAAMQGICEKLIDEIQHEWQTRRQKQLIVPELLVNHIARKAYVLDEKSKSREGGRIVRKLIADLVEANLQRAIASRPDEYRAAQTVRIEFPEPAAEDANERPPVTVQFGSE